MFKVAYLLGSIDRGGTETLISDIFRNASLCNYKFIGIYRKEGNLLFDFKQTNITLLQLFPSNKLDLFYIIKLRRIFISHNISIVHAQQPLDALYAHFASIGTGIKVILTFHGYDFNLKWLDLKILKYIIRKTDINIFVSRNQQDYYIEKYDLLNLIEKQKVIYNGISFDKFNDTKIKSLRKEFNIPDDYLLLGSVGNFTDVRDPITLCRFAKLLYVQGEDFRLFFAGVKDFSSPEKYDECLDFCRVNGILDKVIFLGSRNDIPNILLQLDAFLYATDHDTFGISVIEAIAAGIPVFVNDWKVMQEITDNGDLAILYKTKDINDLLNKFNNFLQNKEIYKQKTQENAIKAIKKYSIENHISELEKVYSSLFSTVEQLNS